MEKFLKDLEKELKSKKLYQHEIDEILAYYEEIISDRYENGEAMDRIIESYDIRMISRMAFPQALSKREPENRKEVSKNIGSLLIFLFSMPILIPLGVIYLAFIIVVFALIISSVAVGISGILGFIVLMFQVLQSGSNVGTFLALIGAYVAAISLVMIILYYISYLFMYLLKGSVKIISRLVSGGHKAWK